MAYDTTIATTVAVAERAAMQRMFRLPSVAAAPAVDTAAVSTADAVSYQPSLIWARPLTVLSTSATGFQGDLIAANGGFVAGFAEVDGDGRVVSLTPNGVLIDPATRRARRTVGATVGQTGGQHGAPAASVTPAQVSRAQAAYAGSAGAAGQMTVPVASIKV